ncbi:MAG: hypothetical protein OXI24_20335 [Candidatus Poribacteria bacterium]|nr:hypothetical protein [Candidatus Poribacteria bacterium]
MVRYNFTISDSAVVKIADEVIMYLNKYPEDYVDCTIMKVISDKNSQLSWEFIINNASTLPFPLSFNGEEVDQLGFIRRMFEVREKLVDRVKEHVTREMGAYNFSPMSDPDKLIDFDKLLSRIGRIVSIVIRELIS